jgi:hypothetical protein
MNRPFFFKNQDKNIDEEVCYVCIEFPNLNLILLTMAKGISPLLTGLYVARKRSGLSNTTIYSIFHIVVEAEFYLEKLLKNMDGN